jgi:hypothetical protein
VHKSKFTNNLAQTNQRVYFTFIFTLQSALDNTFVSLEGEMKSRYWRRRHKLLHGSW